MDMVLHGQNAISNEQHHHNDDVNKKKNSLLESSSKIGLEEKQQRQIAFVTL